MNSDLEEFIRIVSHDLKSPLTTVEMFTEVLERDLVSNPQRAKEEIERIKISVKRLRNLIDDLAEYSLIGVMESQKLVLNTNVVIEKVLDSLNTEKIDSNNIFYTYLIKKENAKVYVARNIPNIYCDVNNIDLVFKNLFDNSIKFKLSKPLEIYIKGYTDKNRTHLEFQDNGRGMDPKFQDKIFDMCFRLVSYDQIEGTGVGLAIVKKIIDLNNGDVRMHSDGENMGSTVHILFPQNQ